VASVEHEFLGPQPAFAGVGVEGGGFGDEFVPGGAGMDVDFDDAGVGRDFDVFEARVVGGEIAFEDDRGFQGGGAGFEGGEQIDEVFGGGEGREEDVQASVADFDAQGGVGDVGAADGFGNGGGGKMRVLQRGGGLEGAGFGGEGFFDGGGPGTGVERQPQARGGVPRRN
jgi:hypothetical protein